MGLFSFLFTLHKRPMHLGKLPMEQIKRVNIPTTKINTDEVPRVPQRASFFKRAEFGDLGPKVQQERLRMTSKYPLNRSIADVLRKLIPLQEGEANVEQAPIPKDPEELSKHIKSLCYFLDADVVGICEIPEYAWYSHDLKGNSIKPQHKYGIVLLIDTGFETLAASSGDDWISGSQSYRAYQKGALIACNIASYIRQLGYETRAHTSQDSLVLHTPLILLAGLGELSRIGEVVLNPFLGPRFKSVVITTNLPLAIDKPIDFGLQDFCNKCSKCARECPCSAISFGSKVMFNGYEIWKPDVVACTRYRTTNPGGSACGRCLKVCPYNKQNILQHRLGLWFAIHVPASRKFLIWLDDVFEYGKQVSIWKWWLDLEFLKDGLSEPIKTNQRSLRPKRQASNRQVIHLYGSDLNPPPDIGNTPYPVDRNSNKPEFIDD